MATARVSPIASLFPGYFALVMATGIIAVAASQQDIDWLADVLYIAAVAAYVVLLVLLLIRVVRYWQRFAADLTNHARGFAFLTLVAATNVLAAASIVIHGWRDLAWVLWWASLVFWALLLYPTLIAVVIRADKPETLHLLMHDAKHLVRGLQEAGFQASAGNLQFSLSGDGDGRRQPQFQQAAAQGRPGSAPAGDAAERPLAYRPLGRAAHGGIDLSI